ncbi:MAG: hypothetical protein L0Y44_16180 [Phycisphaerales bacterium]|nr:hypothetical protein [Phycisphaerales bacterium]
MNASPSQPSTWPPAAIGLAAILILLLWLAGFTGPSSPSAAVDALWILLTSAPLAAAWFVAAIGLGWPLRLWLARQSEDGLAIQAGIGVAAMLTLDAALGSIGALQVFGGAGTWVLTVLGAALAVAQLIRSGRIEVSKVFPHWLVWTSAPAIAVLLIAACAAPGVLWATEFGGYDALSYHLQLPKEWVAIGRIEPLNHNIYSYLPSYVEAAFYHLAIMVGDSMQFVYACQLLHASLALLTAAVLSRFVTRIAGTAAGSLSFVILLATPWVIVTGSLAYNEMAAALMLVTGLLVLHQERLNPAPRAALIGIVGAAACGAKLTAAGMVALPLAVLFALSTRPKQWLGPWAIGAAVFVLVLSPYFIRNQVAAGNPVFPFAGAVFGRGHWIDEQFAVWQRGHISDTNALGRPVELWNQFLRFGVGPNPDQREPWKPQWSILPLLSIPALALAISATRFRRISIELTIVLAVQSLFWLTFTHLKSRFMLPAVVPMSAAIALGALAFRERWLLPARHGWGLRASLAATLLVLATVPALIYRSEAGNAPSSAIGQVGVFTGDALTIEQRNSLGSSTFPTIAVNHLLPPRSKVLLIGDAKALYYDLDRIDYQTTWDRGVLSQLMREYPDDPARWSGGLRQQGFTHLLVDESMLRVWERAGWNDPLLTAARINEFARSWCELLYEYPHGVSLHRLHDDLPVKD